MKTKTLTSTQSECKVSLTKHVKVDDEDEANKQNQTAWEFPMEMHGFCVWRTAKLKAFGQTRVFINLETERGELHLRIIKRFISGVIDNSNSVWVVYMFEVTLCEVMTVSTSTPNP